MTRMGSPQLSAIVRERTKLRDNRDTVHEEPPPILGTWRRVYGAVIIYLLVVIAGFTLFTKAFNR